MGFFSKYTIEMKRFIRNLSDAAALNKIIKPAGENQPA